MRRVVAMMAVALMMLVLVSAQAEDHDETSSSRKTLVPIIPPAAPAQADHDDHEISSSRKTLVPIIPPAAPAQADDHDHETSSSPKTLVPIIPPAASLSQDHTPSSTADCDTKCSAECSLAKRFPKHYAACIDHCKKLHCKYPPSYAILKCTVTCVDSISPKLASDIADKVLNEDHVKACYNGCKKNVNFNLKV